MEPIEFSVDQLDNYTMWFMLDKIKSGPITMVRRTPAGDEPFVDSGMNSFKAFRMKDGHILLGINHFMKFTAKHNLYAISGNVEEVVNIQMFENIMDVYDVPLDNKDKGYFFFVGSTVIAPEEEWRCDNTRYGPLGFNVIEGIEEAVIRDFSEIVSYETIFSVEGVGHLLYLQYKNDDEYRYYFANAATFPFAGVTISEALKLITEWAAVNDAPFNNTQPISKTAREFLDKMDFDNSLVAYQADMYVAEYLKGNPDARKRPENVLPLSLELSMFIKKKMAYRCLSALISLYPDSWNVQEIIDNEEEALSSIHTNFWIRMMNQNKPIAQEIFKNNVEKTMALHNTIKTTGKF